MYLYVVFFNQEARQRGNLHLTGNLLDPIKKAFPQYKEVRADQIKACIGLVKGIENRGFNCQLLTVQEVNADDSFLHLDFVMQKELELTNEMLDRSLYRHAVTNGLLNERNYYPLVWFLDQADFDAIRLSTSVSRKATSHNEQIARYQQENSWQQIVELYQPLEELTANPIWHEHEDLYDLGYACSKLGQLRNGQEKDKKHLETISKYRNLALTCYKRCHELAPRLSLYPSGLAYIHYASIIELTRYRGRKDGDVAVELQNALTWLDKALELNNHSIIDLYRKGRLLLDEKLVGYNSARRDAGIKCLEELIEIYNTRCTPEQQAAKKYEYVSSLYTLGVHYSEQARVDWLRYGVSALWDAPYDYALSRSQLECLVTARDYLERCFQAENEVELKPDQDPALLLNSRWNVAPMDLFYRLGLVYLTMYFVRIVAFDMKVREYAEKAENYLQIAYIAGEQARRQRRSGRQLGHILEKLAWFYICNEQYGTAADLLKNSREGYVKNTYGLTLMLEGSEQSLAAAKTALKQAAGDSRNLARDVSIVLLAHLSILTGEPESYASEVEQAGKLSARNRELLLLAQRGQSNVY